MAVNKTFQIALQAHQQGNFEQAEYLYRKLLEEEPERTKILHLLSIVLAQQKRFDQALQYMEEAIALDASQSTFYHSLGNI